jgi:hypothetical protein
MAGSEWIDWLDASFIKRGIFPRSDVGILERLYKDWDGAEEGNAFFILPRQARDTHRERLNNRRFSLQA